MHLSNGCHESSREQPDLALVAKATHRRNGANRGARMGRKTTLIESTKTTNSQQEGFPISADVSVLVRPGEIRDVTFNHRVPGSSPGRPSNLVLRAHFWMIDLPLEGIADRFFDRRDSI